MVFFITGVGGNKRTAEAQSGTDETILTITYSIGGSDGTPPSWDATGGPHGSGVYDFNGLTDCFASTRSVTLSASDDMDISSEPDTTAFWFKSTDTANPLTDDENLVYWDWSSSEPTWDYYKVYLEAVTGHLVFTFTTDIASDITVCETNADFYDGNWHHVTAVREDGITVPADDDKCTLYVHDLTGTLEESVSQNNFYTSDSADVKGNWLVGSDKNGVGNFAGMIDDVMHWNDYALDSTEAQALAKTNYGTGAHQIDVKLDVTDKDGNYVRNEYDVSAIPIPFYDSKNLGDNDDAGYGIFNVTMNLPEVTISDNQRLNFSMNWVTSTATWEPLDLDMKIDDNTFSPSSSYIQIPEPDEFFPSYLRYDNDFEPDIFIENTGNDGIYFIYAGTRINFNGTGGSFAGLIHSVNGSSATPGPVLSDFVLDGTRDSIHIPPGEYAELFFYPPTDHPSTTIGFGNLITPGLYRTSIWLHGYSDQGETFQRSIVLGIVNVVD